MQEKLDELKSNATDREFQPEDDANAGIAPAENALAFVAAMGATFLARNALQAGWKQTFDEVPPKNPASHEVQWREALLWGAVSGALIGIARIASRRASSHAYRRFHS
ncbi:DUF4235 domain-containing protein [Roseiconus nitratireducens]|uniref:DUF4235 domain-containing protein n=1 Tax=Roseiconus nitratireducens TaxID=2605748 RepID=A0A5M6D917_9BACT|nr:DUF4235 domain-containing protein [Roseiconus nitratireducens]